VAALFSMLTSIMTWMVLYLLLLFLPKFFFFFFPNPLLLYCMHDAGTGNDMRERRDSAAADGVDDLGFHLRSLTMQLKIVVPGR
jgi:hypothetical protein